MIAVNTLRILGIRGLPAAHGGFETFAEQLALHLERRGWNVVVYCQERGKGPVTEDTWRGVTRVHIPVAGDGPWSTIVFDWKCILHAMRSRDVCLTLGYNTAVFCALLRMKGVPNVINMDGIEWARAKWGAFAKTWFWLNDWAGCFFGDHLVADHPEIKRLLEGRVRASKITMIPYGAERLGSMPVSPVAALSLEPGRYLTLIARPEPENSILEVVRGFSARPRGVRLAVLGKYDDRVAYHRAVKAAASEEVSFLGAIYDKPVVHALRFHSLAYVHGHRVGGTNPSLVEALGAGNAIIAHDNRFNRWVVREAACFFTDAEQFDLLLDQVLGDPGKLTSMRKAAIDRFNAEFTWRAVLRDYEDLLLRYSLPLVTQST